MNENLTYKFSRLFEYFNLFFSSPILVNRFSKLALLLLISFQGLSQANIGLQDFEVAPAAPIMTYATASGGALVSGSSAAGDRPATSPFFTSSNRGWSLTNGTSVVTFANVASVGTCNTKYFEFKLAAFSIGSTANGMEPGDIVTVEVSLDGGTSWSREVTVCGAAANNSYWSFAATGVASVVYDGNNTPTAFAAASAGSNAAGHSTVRISLPDACTQARLRVTLLSNAASERWVIDDAKLFGTCPSGCTPTAEPATEASSVTVSEGCTSAQLTFANGDGVYRMVVMSTNCTITDPVDQTNYTSSSTYGSGNTTGASDYVVYNGSASTTIVSGLTAGTSYCFKIYEYNLTTVNCDENYLNATFNTSFTTLSSCANPEIRSILVNACTVAEGTDEVVIITNGNSALDVNDIQIDFPSGGSFCNSGCGGQTFVNNASYVNDLNTLAGCSLFQYATTIPANATVVVFTGSTPTMTFNYSSECPGGGPYYVIFANNTNTAGRFANAADANRSLTVDFGGSTDVVTFYSSNANTGTDGDFVSFDNGGTPSYGSTSSCSTPLILSVNWDDFNLESEKNTAILSWSTLSERNNDYFDIEMSDATSNEFQKVGQLAGNASTSQKSDYEFIVNNIEEGYYLFRLKQVDFDGKFSYSEIKSLNVTGDNFSIKKILSESNATQFSMNQDIARGSTIRLHEITGKILYEGVYYDSGNEFTINQNLKGLVILSIEDPIRGVSTFKILLD